MGVSIYVKHVEVKSVEQFPFLKAVLEQNTEKQNVLGLECYVWQDFEGQSVYDWDLAVEGIITDKQKQKEIKKVRKKMEEEYLWEESEEDKEYEYEDNEANYIDYMVTCNDKINSYTASVDL